jgi:hypothetical protein
MAKVPLPERGQPLDVAYIYTLADTINDLSSQVSSATFNYTTIDTPSAGKQSVKTSESKFIGGIIQVAGNINVSTTEPKDFTYDFPSDYKYPPIVSATAVNVGNTPAGQNVSIVIKTVTTSKVEGTVTFNTNGNASVNVHLMLMGIPN